MTDDRRMIHVRHDGVAHVELDTAFAYVADHRTVPEWMYGVTRFEPVGEQVRGVGAVFDACMRIGPAAFTSRLEIVEWEDNHRIVLSSISGFRTRSAWQFDDLGDGDMRLAVDFGYQLPGGLAGRAAGLLIEPLVGTIVRRTENALRDQVVRNA